MGNTPGGADAIGVIEVELMKLVRHLETFARRSSLYVRVDRAGYLAMRVLDGLGPVSTHALAQALHLDGSTVTRQIARLERTGLIERCPDPADGRSSTIALTPEGRRVMGDVQGERRRRIEALVSGWDGVAQADLAAALTRLNSSLAESVAESARRAQCRGAQVTA
jgi:DNA-binding MarR family transcriptional regulator